MTQSSTSGRKLAQGAEVVPDGVSFRIYAPDHDRVELFLCGRNQVLPLQPDGGGYWSLLVPDLKERERYFYRLDGDPTNLPDPCARYLPEGPHGPAEVVDASSFVWSDAKWSGLSSVDHVIYELHVGSFSPEGNWAGLEAKLPWLSDLGVTTLEVMPVAEFAGGFGWGYDGVAWFSPSHLYGTPDGFRRVVDRAHGLGMAVILDVVYNHFGIVGDYTSTFSRHYASDHNTEWGKGLNYDGPDAEVMRRLVTDNASYWIDEFHLDGLRLDAIHAIRDRSPEHIVIELARAARLAGKGRKIFVVGENERQDARLLKPTDGAAAEARLDALWNDDFHHTSRVALTGRRQAYLSDFFGRSDEWIGAAKRGFVYQGQVSRWQDLPRGHATTGLPTTCFVAFLENHDQVANSLWGTRLWQQSSPPQFRAMTSLLLLGPWIPFLFQGQEWNATAPFFYFADHVQPIAGLVNRGRAGFLSQFPGCADHPELLRDPASADTFAACRLDWAEAGLPEHARSVALHRDLLRLRHTDPTLSRCRQGQVQFEVATLTRACGLVRYFTDSGQDRLLIVNLGVGLDLERVTTPLLAPPEHHGRWTALWNSEEPRYGGFGCAAPDSGHSGWAIPGAAAIFLAPVPDAASRP